MNEKNAPADIARWISIKEAQALRNYDVSVSVIRKWCKQGLVRCHKWYGRLWMIDPNSIKGYQKQ